MKNEGYQGKKAQLGEIVPCMKENTESTINDEAKLAIGKKYSHFKGNEYLVLDLARHSETLEDLVVYQALYGDYGIWVRPLAMFIEEVEVNGKMINRFEQCE